MELSDLLKHAPALAANLCVVLLFLKHMRTEALSNREAHVRISESDHRHQDTLQRRMEESGKANTDALVSVVAETTKLRGLIGNLEDRRVRREVYRQEVRE